MIEFLLGRRAYKIIALAICSLMLAACTADSGMSREEAVELGIIAPYGQELTIGTLNFAYASLGDLTTNTTVQANVNFTNFEQVEFSRTDGTVEIFVQDGQSVYEGQLLARQTFGMNVAAELSLFSATQRLEEFDRDFNTERNRQLAAIADARAAGLSNLEIELLEIALELFEIRSADTRIGIASNLEFQQSTLIGEEIFAPFDGIVLWVNSFASHMPWSWNIGVVAHNDSITFNAWHDTSENTGRLAHFDILRYGETYLVRSERPRTLAELGLGATHFSVYARVASDARMSGNQWHFYTLIPLDENDIIETMLAIDPYAHPLYTIWQFGTLEVAVEVVLAQDAVLVPIRGLRTEQVHARLTRHYVIVYEDGNLGRRYVQLGELTANHAQILSGLDVGARVVLLP